MPCWLAPVTSTLVPTGSEPESQPFVSVELPVPEQWAAWPMYVVVPSEKTKLAVHWAPSVNVCTPGCTVALSAGAQAFAAGAKAAIAAQAVTASAAIRRCTRIRRVLPPSS